MYIEKITVTAENMMEVITDSSIHVIKKYDWTDSYQLIPIRDADVSDLLADRVAIIKIIK